MRRYVYRCEKCGDKESNVRDLNTCVCGRPLKRVYDATPLYHPSKGAK